MYHTCTIHVPYMYHTCTIHVPYMYHACTMHVPCMYHTCTILVQCLLHIHMHTGIQVTFRTRDSYLLYHSVCDAPSSGTQIFSITAAAATGCGPKSTTKPRSTAHVTRIYSITPCSVGPRHVIRIYSITPCP